MRCIITLRTEREKVLDNCGREHNRPRRSRRFRRGNGAYQQSTMLAAITAANNEQAVLQPIAEIAESDIAENFADHPNR
jgi:hypothetical protein